ncbi:hypothetical protein C8R43DRAFT_1241125 [Mycena crocata]|nr:hypothetical protein C8R43DRAFT_1241125 [Mycena crocata]
MMQHLGPETALMGRGTFRIFAAGGWLEANIPVELQSSVSTQTLVYHASASHCTATALCTARRMKIPHTGSNCTYIPIRNHTFDSILAAFLSEFCRRRPTPRYDLKVPYFPNRQHLAPTCEPPRSGGGSNYTTYRNPASGLNFGVSPHLDLHFGVTPMPFFQNFCRRRPTPRYDFKAPYFRNRQHLPCTREPPRSGGGSKYATYPNPARGLKFHFLPPEANAPLRLESNISP